MFTDSYIILVVLLKIRIVSLFPKEYGSVSASDTSRGDPAFASSSDISIPPREIVL